MAKCSIDGLNLLCLVSTANIRIDCDWTWTGPGLDLDRTWTGPGPELDNIQIKTDFHWVIQVKVKACNVYFTSIISTAITNYI